MKNFIKSFLNRYKTEIIDLDTNDNYILFTCRYYLPKLYGDYLSTLNRYQINVYKYNKLLVSYRFFYSKIIEGVPSLVHEQTLNLNEIKSNLDKAYQKALTVANCPYIENDMTILKNGIKWMYEEASLFFEYQFSDDEVK